MPGVTIDRMKEGYSQIRNRALAYAFSYMNLIEGWGTGIPRLLYEMEEYGLPEPEFIDMELALRINLYRGQNGVKTNGTNDHDGTNNVLSENEKALITILEKEPAATQKVISDKLGISVRTVKRIISDLHEKDILVGSSSASYRPHITFEVV